MIVKSQQNRIELVTRPAYFQSQPHTEKDSSSKECNVYDVIFNPLAETKASEDPRFKRLLDDTSLDAVEKAFDVKV